MAESRQAMRWGGPIVRYRAVSEPAGTPLHVRRPLQKQGIGRALVARDGRAFSWHKGCGSLMLWVAGGEYAGTVDSTSLLWSGWISRSASGALSWGQWVGRGPAKWPITGSGKGHPEGCENRTRCEGTRINP